MHSTFIWQLNLRGSFVSKLPYKGKVFFEGLWTYRGVFELGTIPEGRLEWEGKPCLVGRKQQKLQKVTAPSSYHSWEERDGALPGFCKRPSEKLCLSVFHQQITKMFSPCLLPWRRRYSVSLSAEGWKDCGIHRLK